MSNAVTLSELENDAAYLEKDPVTCRAQIFPFPVPQSANSERQSVSGSYVFARHWYIARAMTFPKFSGSNARLVLVRRLAWLLVAFQILDGFFTSMGVHVFGIEVEGNPLIREIMAVLGAPLGIALVKAFAIAIIFSICIFGFRVSWLTRALSGLAAIYFLFAIIPWTWLLVSFA